jgi:hypothetical protein
MNVIISILVHLSFCMLNFIKPFFVVVGLISTAAMKAYCTLTP